MSFASSIFLKFSQYCCKTSIIQIQQRKVKNRFLDKKKKKKKKKIRIPVYEKLHRSDHFFFAINLILR